MVRIGIIGVGFMGMAHFDGTTRTVEDAATGRRRLVGSRLNGAEVTAIATRNQARLGGDWTGIQGNFGPRGGMNDLSCLKRYADYHELLADPDIDLVDICLPTDQHEQVVLESVRAGKHTLVEKPIAVDPAAADRMVLAAEEAGVQLMVAHVLPFFPEFAFGLNAVQSGQYGALKAAHFRRVICPPNWSDGMSDFRKLGGWGVDLHIHDNHFISALCGAPREVFARGALIDGFVNHVHATYVFDDPDLAVSCVSGGIAAQGLAFAHGYELYLEQATIVFGGGTYGGNWVTDRPLLVLTNDGRAESPQLESGEWCSAFTAELQMAADGVRTGQTPAMLSGTIARDALRLCYAEAESIRAGLPISLT